MTISSLSPTPDQNTQVRWSAVNRRFLEAADRMPALLERATFAAVHDGNPLAYYQMQSWPIFLDRAVIAEFERVTCGLVPLFKSIPERFFATDAGRIARYYDFGDPALVEMALESPNGIEAAPARCDFIDSARGLQCLELNCGSYLGGWNIQAVEPLVLGCPEVASFLADYGVTARHRNTVRQTFEHMIDDTVRRGIWQEGDFNLAVVIYPQSDEWVATHPREIYRHELHQALATRGMRGRLLVCGYDDLEPQGRVLAHGDLPVHALLEQQAALTDPRAFRCFKAGMVNLFSGPITQLLSDKRNLALLSENAGSDLFSAAERELIERHVPWTRRTGAGEVTWKGRQVGLRELLEDRREDLVLKQARSMSGQAVFLGKYTPPQRWQALVDHALAEPDWLVQERVEPLTCTFQSGARGTAPYEVIWGNFDIGGRYGGSFVRMMRKGAGAGVINAGQQAQVGIPLEVEEPEASTDVGL